MRAVGKNTAEMLAQLITLGLDITRLELLGLSMGGQTISYISKSFFQITGRKIGRLTALDPSGPCFRHLGPEKRLDATDAEFVNVVYTNIDGFGMAVPAGHVNFYVNGGELQGADLLLLPCTSFCSHMRALTVWVSALLHPQGFVGIKCDSVQQARLHACYDRHPVETNVIGLKVNQTRQGVFYVATDNNWPYYLGEKGVSREGEFWLNRLSSWNKEDLVVL